MNLLKPDSSSFPRLLDLLLSFLDGILLKDPLIPEKTKDLWLSLATFLRNNPLNPISLQNFLKEFTKNQEKALQMNSLHNSPSKSPNKTPENFHINLPYAYNHRNFKQKFQLDLKRTETSIDTSLKSPLKSPEMMKSNAFSNNSSSFKQNFYLDLKKTGSYYENPLKIPLKAEESDEKTMKPEDFKQNDSPYMIKYQKSELFSMEKRVFLNKNVKYRQNMSKKVKKISSFLEKSGFFIGKVPIFNEFSGFC